MSDKFLDRERTAELWQAIKERSIPTKAVTSAEYNALSEHEKMADIQYIITDDNSESGGTGGASGEIYSTEEVRIGTWIDGEALYRKTVVFKATGNESKVPISGYSELVTAYGSGISSNAKALIPSSGSSVFMNGGDIIVYLKNATVGSNITITLEYTKTTD